MVAFTQAVALIIYPLMNHLRFVFFALASVLCAMADLQSSLDTALVDNGLGKLSGKSLPKLLDGGSVDADSLVVVLADALRRSKDKESRERLTEVLTDLAKKPGPRSYILGYVAENIWRAEDFNALSRQNILSIPRAGGYGFIRTAALADISLADIEGIAGSPTSFEGTGEELFFWFQ